MNLTINLYARYLVQDPFSQSITMKQILPEQLRFDETPNKFLYENSIVLCNMKKDNYRDRCRGKVDFAQIPWYVIPVLCSKVCSSTNP